MKTKEEIEHLAFKSYGDTLLKGSFIHGYNQCQEDMANKKYTEEDMRECWRTCLNYRGINYQDFINSLNKQD
jgi:hypothetical protein